MTPEQERSLAKMAKAASKATGKQKELLNLRIRNLLKKV